MPQRLRGIVAVLAAGTIFTALGCAEPERPAAPPATGGSATVPGTVPEGTSLATFVATVDFAEPVVVERWCRGRFWCGVPLVGRKVQVSIAGVRGTEQFNPRLGSGRTVVGRMHNLAAEGGPSERLFALEPKTDYFVVVYHSPEGASARLVTTADTMGRDLNWKECPHGSHEPKPQQAADFCSCDRRCPDRGSAQGPAISLRTAGVLGKLAALASGLAGGPAWFKCTAGCCTSEPT